MEANYFMAGQLLVLRENKVKETTEMFGTLGPQSAIQAIAPGKNRVIFLLGHLLKVHDCRFTTLALGKRKYTAYDHLFLAPQHPANKYPGFQVLLDQWISLNDNLVLLMRQRNLDDWMSKHHHINEADFLLRPGKNKFCVLLCITTLLCRHGGQLALTSN